MSILSQFTFKGQQELAVRAAGPAIAVTAGAGSGKTRVLAGRYLHLLEQGHPLRSLIAITFTEKAAREMRTRIRSELEHWSEAAADPGQPEPPAASWLAQALNEFDSARIGTIHSLCAELLRAHPAEAGVDPAFGVLDEGMSAALRTQAIQTALAWAANDVAAAQLFTYFKENELRRLLADLLNRRLDLENWLAGFTALPGNVSHGDTSDPLSTWSAALADWMDAQFSEPDWQAAMAELPSLQAQKPDDKLEMARRDVLAHWESTLTYIHAGAWDAVFEELFGLRKAISTTAGSKTSWRAGDLENARDAMRALGSIYDEQIKPLVSKSHWSLDEQAARLLPALRQLTQHAFDSYERSKDEQQELDFDDLEGRAARLLVEHPGVRARWQANTDAVLVDEFQDTNDRQRLIVYALSNFSPPGAEKSAEGALADQESANSGIFIVGDAKQSIYKFRGADVTVFRQVQADIAETGGLIVSLELTFRAHQPLLDLLNPLLATILGKDNAEADHPRRPYQVPFAPLQADRPAPKTASPPYLEFHIGCGENAEEGRAAAAAALARRLQRLCAEERFQWSDIALLFRASTAFEVYEDELERTGIPFVTVAGRGFYSRPEIRDIMNILVAIADPTDNLALAGALRSPAFALPDGDLYHLRYPAPETAEAEHLWPALQKSLDPLHQHASAILSELQALAGRAPAAEVLKRLLDLTGLRAMLGFAPGGGRMLRNVDKLLADAHRSQLVGLGEFLEYIQTLRSVGLREGEAPVEVGGALQLMTVHKSKGLEFPVVVICDAAYEPRSPTAGALFDPGLGLLPGLKDTDELRPAVWRVVSLNEAAKDEAEDRRLLYVAATRAREKLLVSGHTRVNKSGRLSLHGWLRDFGESLGMDEVSLEAPILDAQELLATSSPQAAVAISWALYPPMTPAGTSAFPASFPTFAKAAPGDLVAPLATPAAVQLDERTQARQNDPPEQVWRVVPKSKRPSGPAWLVGQLVHEALRRWQFPRQDDGEEPRWETFMRPYALEAGLTGEVEIHATLQEVRRLLERFQAHPLCTEIEAAERYHELPYVLPDTGFPDHQRGVIDLLYRVNVSSPWVIVDFKTDDVESEAVANQLIQRAGYDQQIRRYADEMAIWLGSRPSAKLVFLGVAGEVMVYDSIDWSC